MYYKSGNCQLSGIRRKNTLQVMRLAYSRPVKSKYAYYLLDYLMLILFKYWHVFSLTVFLSLKSLARVFKYCCFAVIPCKDSGVLSIRYACISCLPEKKQHVTLYLSIWKTTGPLGPVAHYWILIGNVKMLKNSRTDDPFSLNWFLPKLTHRVQQITWKSGNIYSS